MQMMRTSASFALRISEYKRNAFKFKPNSVNQERVEVIPRPSTANITMKLVLVCTAVVLLSSAGQLARLARRRSNSIERMFREANITPVPEEKVDLYYGDYKVTTGMDVDPGKAIGLPFIEVEPDCYYTVIKRTVDEPYPNNSFLSPYLMGMYVNARENSKGCLLLEEACEIATWLGPNPRPGTGRHRFAVFVYKQNEMINANDEDLCRYQQNRQLFSIEDFAETYNLISPPAGGSYFYAEYPYPSKDWKEESESEGS